MGADDLLICKGVLDRCGVRACSAVTLWSRHSSAVDSCRRCRAAGFVLGSKSGPLWGGAALVGERLLDRCRGRVAVSDTAVSAAAVVSAAPAMAESTETAGSPCSALREAKNPSVPVAMTLAYADEEDRRRTRPELEVGGEARHRAAVIACLDEDETRDVSIECARAAAPTCRHRTSSRFFREHVQLVVSFRGS